MALGTKIGYGVALLAGVATILGWLESSQWVRAFPGWLQKIVSQPWFLSTALALTVLALIGVVLSKLRAMESRYSGLEALEQANHAEALAKVNSLESRVWQQVNESFGQVRDQLQSLERRVTKLEPGLAGIALQVQDQKEEKYKVVSSDGTVREWKRGEIDDLPEAQQRKLFDQHPDLSDWWLGKPKS